MRTEEEAILVFLGPTIGVEASVFSWIFPCSVPKDCKAIVSSRCSKRSSTTISCSTICSGFRPRSRFSRYNDLTDIPVPAVECDEPGGCSPSLRGRTLTKSYRFLSKNNRGILLLSSVISTLSILTAFANDLMRSLVQTPLRPTASFWTLSASCLSLSETGCRTNKLSRAKSLLGKSEVED
jgi:hypothetical protein